MGIKFKYGLHPYPVGELEGCGATVLYMSYGHHDKQEFIEYLRNAYPESFTDWKVQPTEETIEHLYYRVVPAFPGESVMMYHKSKKGRGAFPVTVWDVERLNVEWHLAKTEANQKVLAEAQT